MTIWQYGNQGVDPPKGLVLQECRYCNTSLEFLTGSKGGRASDPWSDRQRDGFNKSPDWAWIAAPDRWLNVCPTCGWWSVSTHNRTEVGLDVFGSVSRAVGSLRKLDLSDISLPLEELSQYLVASYDERFRLNPRRYEDVVASVFANSGYHVRATAYSGDQGIDLFVFDGDAGGTVGVQVKRYADKIEAEQIREFAGSLLLNKVTSGIFVTTSSYTRGAVAASRRYTEQGLAVDLWDAATFYDRLRLVTRAPYSDANDPSAPFAAAWNDSAGLQEVATFSAGRG
jgi:restriction system protein